MSTRYAWNWEAPTPGESRDRLNDELWDDCPGHLGVGCDSLLCGGIDNTTVMLYFSATKSRSVEIADILDRHFGETGKLERMDFDYWSDMRRAYRRKKRGWK